MLVARNYLRGTVSVLVIFVVAVVVAVDPRFVRTVDDNQIV